MRGCHQSLHPHSRPWHTLLGLPLGCQPRPRALLSTNPSPNWWALPKPVSPAQRLFWLVLGLGCALVCSTDECAQSVAASQGWEKGWMARVTWVSGGKKPSQVLLPLEVGRWGRQEKGRALWLLGALLCSALARAALLCKSVLPREVISSAFLTQDQAAGCAFEQFWCSELQFSSFLGQRILTLSFIPPQ